MLGYSNYNELAYEDFQTTPVRYTRSYIYNQLRSSRAQLCVSQYYPDYVNLALQIQELKSELDALRVQFRPADALSEYLSCQHRYFEDKFQRVYAMLQAFSTYEKRGSKRGYQPAQLAALADSVAAQFSELYEQVETLRSYLSDDMRDKLAALREVPLHAVQLLSGLETTVGILGARLNKCENAGIMYKKQIDALLNVIEDYNQQIIALRAALEAQVQRSVLEASRVVNASY